MRAGRFDSTLMIAGETATEPTEPTATPEPEPAEPEPVEPQPADPEPELDPARVDDHGFYLDFDYALEQARQQNKPLLVDFNGRFCVPCRLMERTVFTLPEVEALFENFVIVSVLTDVRDPVSDELWRKYRPSANAGVPYYAVLNHEAEIERAIGATLPADERGHEFVAFLRGEAPASLPPEDMTPEVETPEGWPEGLHPPMAEDLRDKFEFTPVFTADRVQPGGQVTLELRISLKEGDSGPYSLYHPDSPHSVALGVSLFRIEDFDAGGLEPAGDWKFPEPKVVPVDDPANVFDDDEWKFYGDLVVTRTFTVPSDAADGMEFIVKGGLVGQYCDLQGCFWFADMSQNPFGWYTTLTAAADGVASALVEPAMDTGGAEDFKAPDTAAAPPEPVDESLRGLLDQHGLILMLLLIFGLGMVTLLTPCVLPVLPLTISFFVKQAEQGRSSLLAALIYCTCIVLTFTTFGLLTSLLLGSTGAQLISTNGFVNIAIGILFVVLALSFFGAFELQMPQFIRQWISRKQMGAQQKGNGYITALLSGGSFSVISFSCTGPIAAAILAGVAGVSGGDGLSLTVIWLPTLAMLAFSLGLAAPIFVLGQFPSLMKRIPKSGGWMNALKVVFAFIEVAIAIRYFAWADMYFSEGSYPAIFTREIVDAVWIACFLGAGLYLLGVFRLSHDHEPVERIGTTRTLIAITFLTFAVWMLPGLIQGKPMGLVDGFLPPRDRTTFATGGVEGQAALPALDFSTDFEASLEKARELGKPVFLDFTGDICANCRWVEQYIFPQRVVHSRLTENFVLVAQYTDRRGDEGREARRLYDQYAQGSGGVPMYVIVDGEGNTIERFVPPQYINSLTADRFAEFLDSGLAQFEAARR
jgi:thiol:disulfide interchange protein